MTVVPREGNPYLHSLWVGLTGPFLNLPMMVWDSLIWPILIGLRDIGLAFFLGFIAGVSGRAAGFAERD